MKKYLVSILLIVVIAFGFVACAQKDNVLDSRAPEGAGGVRIDSGEISAVEPSGIPSGEIPHFDGSTSEAIGYIRDGGTVKYLDGGYVVYRKDGSVAGALTDEEAREVIQARAGMLTACAYDDHGSIDYWKGLLTSTQEGPGKYAEYYQLFAFKALHQVKVTAQGLPQATILLKDGDVVLFAAKTDNAGVGYLYAPEWKEGLQVELVLPQDFDQASLRKEAQAEVVFDQDEIGGEAGDRAQNVELMFVIDTTGSMGDEIDYLKKEIADVIARVKEATQAEVTLALMVYRDEGDEYVTLYSDFTKDIDAQKAWLEKQHAGGGGDFEEAVETALSEAVSKQWSAKCDKYIVHVADAPAHDKKVNEWDEAILDAARAGIKVLTVASSGIDQKTEYFFRSQSLLTGGVYVYLTDDSGIGGCHLEADVEERPKVEYLNDCLVRLISVLHEGRATDAVIQLPADKTVEVEPGQEQEPKEEAPDEGKGDDEQPTSPEDEGKTEEKAGETEEIEG